MTKQITHKLFLLTLIAALGVNFLGRPTAAQPVNPPILITEVQTGFTDEFGVEFPRHEFIELTNVSGGHVNLAGWKLEYLSAANNGSSNGLVIDHLGGQLAANGRGLWNHDGYNPALPDSIFGVGDVSASGYFAKSGGHIRLMNGTSMVDCVAWGSAVAITDCDKVSAIPGAGYTIQRQLTNNGYDKSAGVANLKPANPKGGNVYSVSATPPVLPPFVSPVELTPQKDCDGIELSEILANPIGEDASAEFIELYNPTDQTQSLYGCIIKLNNGKQYEFPLGTSLLSREYKAFTYAATNLQLTNSGAVVTLVTISNEISTTYPVVTDNQAWALIDGKWQLTGLPTPGADNVLSLTVSNDNGTVIDSVEPCPPGKYRNLETNRCRNIVETTSSLAVCAPDQERNPETGRCKKRTVVASTTCPVGQERNMVTNRCRKLEVAGASTKSCDTGQERNPETGRCRKVMVAKSVAKPDDATGPKTYHYVLVGTILMGVCAYGAYEYRHDLMNILSRLRTRLAVKK